MTSALCQMRRKPRKVRSLARVRVVRGWWRAWWRRWFVTWLWRWRRAGVGWLERVSRALFGGGWLVLSSGEGMGGMAWELGGSGDRTGMG